MRYILCGVAALALTACTTSVPDSAAGVVDTGQGVGFNNYDSYRAEREAQLNGATGQSALIAPPADVQSGTLDPQDAAASQQAAALNSGQAPIDASPSNPAPQMVENSAGISGENDFDAVSAQRDIAADAAMIQQNRAQYQVIQPTDLPTRPGTNRPNIVEYALRTTNPVGTALYKRSSLRAETRYQNSCGAFASPDLAQEEFLALGGPEKDRKGMDPDGDGYACGWNPAPFRAAKG
ncbi:MAG: hypothetical protein ACU0CC_03085 [Sagittula sp.]|jgi:hypothetical protein|uniref:hypothetical protein n=1 Tax=unclassified Sagittula TaxID=2624628 RepID=UPI0018E251C6|nr:MULTISPECIES: hypothetical protein [unclassified Sagittula]WHZ36819.1 hypothetical protein QNI11_07330 [Sagittula sp. MA-2]